MKKTILLCIYAIFLCFRFNTAADTVDSEKNKRFYNEDFTPQQVITALKKAYPDRIGEITYRNDDWAVKVYNTWYYWAGGRLLPEELIPLKENYNAYTFYRYPDSLPPFTEPDKETRNRIDTLLDERIKNPIQRYPGFMDSLWRIHDKASSWKQVKTTYFLGYKLLIHRDLLEDLAAVEEEIQNRMPADRELSAFVKSLVRIDGYNWRQIAGTVTRSGHSYGTAIDLILNSKEKRQIYWLWTQNSGLNFCEVPYEQRFSPPESFIRAFENHGFVWGGKWLFYDTIHFEYRPDILILNGLKTTPKN